MKIVALDRAYWPRGGFGHWCPGCNSGHEIDTEEPNASGAKWSFNGDHDRPTFSPSINIRWGNKVPGHESFTRGGACHYFVTDGQIVFCADSTHAFAGQTVVLPDLPEKCYLTSQRAARKAAHAPR